MTKLTVVFALLAGVVLLSVSACQNSGEIEYKRYFTAGKLVYQNSCQNCHGQNGEGLSALIPPLTDTAFIKANGKSLSCFLKSGVSKMMKVNGKFYEEKMPPTGLAPVQIAEVLTYVRNSFGNKAGVIDVHSVEEDLKNCP